MLNYEATHVLLLFNKLNRCAYYKCTMKYYCLCGSVVKASDTQAVGHGFDPRPDH